MTDSMAAFNPYDAEQYTPTATLTVSLRNSATGWAEQINEYEKRGFAVRQVAVIPAEPEQGLEAGCMVVFEYINDGTAPHDLLVNAIEELTAVVRRLDRSGP